MTIPEHNETVTDGALAFSGEPVSKTWAVVGACSGGTANTLYSFRDPSQLVATLGYGPAVEFLAWLLTQRRGLVYFMKVSTSIAGAASAVTASGGGPTVSVSGTPYDDEQWIVQIRKGGAVGTSTFRYSRDGGDTWSADIVTAASYAVPNSGITIAFAAGTYVLGETYSFTTSAPKYSSTDFNTTFDALQASGAQFAVLCQIGCPDGADDSAKAAAWAGFAGAVQTKLDTAFAAHRFYRAFIDPADITDNAAGDTAIQTPFANVVAPRVCTFGGFVELKSPLSLRTYKRPATWVAAARVWSIPLGEDPAWVGRGALPAGVTALYHNEDLRPGLDALRIGTLRTIETLNGFYVTNAPLLSAVGSDFRYIQHGLVMDEACRITRRRMLPRLSQQTRYYSAPVPSGKVEGAIYEQDAVAIERDVVAALNRELVSSARPAAQAASAEVNRTQNIVSTETISTKVRVKPFAYPKTLETELGFTPVGG